MQQIRDLSQKRGNHCGRGRIGEKSPHNLVKVANQNFQDLQRNSRYLYAQDSINTLLVGSHLLDQASPKHALPKLRSRWVSLDAANISSMIQKDTDTHFRFQQPAEDFRRTKQFSLDYSNIQRIMKQRYLKNTSPQEKILQIIAQQTKKQAPPATHRVLLSKFSQASQNFAQNLKNSGEQPKYANMLKTFGSSLREEVPAHFTYPETNMALTCNYFGANDYSRKHTIRDIRNKVIEQRSASKRDTTDFAMNKTFLIGQSSVDSYTNQTGDFFSIAAGDQIGQQECSCEKIQNKQIKESSSSDTDGCKGVQIDSSMDMHPDEYFQKIEEDMKGSPPSTEQISSRHQNQWDASYKKINMSTQLFNGDYLVQTVNQSSPLQGSHFNSKQMLPTQRVHQITFNTSPKTKVPRVKSLFKKSPKAQGHQYLTYFKGPQVNQINLHVHFSGSLQSSKISPSNANMEPEPSSDQPDKFHQSSQDFEIAPLPLSVNHGSKETLNQSSSKGLANLFTFNQAQDGSRLGFTPIKYSSIQSQNLASRQNSTIDAENTQEKKASQADGSEIGIDLNSFNSEKSTDRLKNNTTSFEVPLNAETQTYKFFNSVAETEMSYTPNLLRTRVDCSKLIEGHNSLSINQEKHVYEPISIATQLKNSQEETSGTKLILNSGMRLKKEGFTINKELENISQEKKPAIIKITTRPLNNSVDFTESTPPELHSDLRQHSQNPMTLDHTKNLYKKSTYNQRSSTKGTSPMAQLHVANYIAKLISSEKDPDKVYHKVDNRLCSTMQGYFQDSQQAKQLEVQQKSILSPFSNRGQNNNTELHKTTVNMMPEMYRTIMQPDNQWQSFDMMTDPRRTVRFNPNQSGFTTMSKDFSNYSRLDLAQYRSLNATRQTQKTFSIEMQADERAAANGESIVLFKVSPNGNVGRFRPRQKHRKETFGERNSRLGHISHRISPGKNKITAPQKGHISLEIAGVTEGFGLNSEMLKTNTTAFSKRTINRELTDLELNLQVLPSSTVTTANYQIANMSVKQNQVIFEESLTEAQINHDREEEESHISQTLTTFDSSPTTLVHLNLMNHGKRFDEKDLSFTTNRKALDKQSSKEYSPNNLQQIIGNLNQRIAYDKGLLEKIKTISAKQQLSNMPANKQAIKHPVYSIKQIKQSPDRKKSKKFEETKISYQDQQVGLKKNNVLEGQSILSIIQNKDSNMPRPPNHSSINSSKALRNTSYSPQPKNLSHIVVVQTPEAVHHIASKQDDLKMRLDIKIRCPSQLLLPEVINAISGKLDLTISLIFFDGSQQLSIIQNGVCPKMVQQRVLLNDQGFVINSKKGSNVTRWNVYDDMFKGQLKLEDLNFMQRQFIVEIEMTDPIKKDIYLLRYLTFNQMVQLVYPKIYISIMQHLNSKKRPLCMFDGMATEVLDFSKEPCLQNGPGDLDKLYRNLIIKDINYPIVMKMKPRMQCPPIRMKGILLESPRRKVQIKSLGEFISISEGLCNRPKLEMLQMQEQSSTIFNVATGRESRETLRQMNQSDSQYVALPVKNQELPARVLLRSELSVNHGQTQHIRSLSKQHTSSTYYAGDKSPKNQGHKPLQMSFSRKQAGSPTNLRRDLAAASPTTTRRERMKLNQNSASRILVHSQYALDPCIQVKKITEQKPKSPVQRKQREEPPQPKPINKQQFHIDANLEKGIDCSFESLGSSEGRHSMNDSVSPVSSIKHKPKDRGRYSSLDVHELSVDGIKQELDEKTRLSRFNLNFGSNMSELEDEHNDTFATTDRLQSIFTMQKKKSDLHEKVKGGVQIIRRGLLSKGSKLLDNEETATRNITNSNKTMDDFKGHVTTEKQYGKVAPLKGSHQRNNHVILEPHVPEEPAIQVPSPCHKKNDAAMSSDFSQPFDQSSPDLKPSVIPQKGPQAIKSIVNILADDVIKEPKEPAKHRVKQLNNKALTRRQNLRHALAEEKSKKILENDERMSSLTKDNLHIKRKEITQSLNQRGEKQPPKIQIQGSSIIAEHEQLQTDEADSEVYSIRRDSMISQVKNFGPILPKLVPEIIIINQNNGGGSPSQRRIMSTSPVIGGGNEKFTQIHQKQIRFEKNRLEVQIFSDAHVSKDISREETAVNYSTRD